MNPNWLTSLVVVVMILTKLVMSSKLSETQLLPCGASLKKNNFWLLLVKFSNR
jgi:hypothetical protein